ncbi:uncharacterized protein [Oryza sativa Japonica Group]|uniref:Os02g0715200 protein n=2 Tax=Oryza sativa subsp. japonica TaxID=39947 RepID=Q6ZHP8_ORYSJ|nr:short-chain dehydrogenase/reductase family 42E member 1 [Oryza sativa Japonica Group]KAB8088620.1 hypothetical protein EE612_013276 [Oryza sativa]KAF2946622.1 hypothetical protein DAI22_02g309500 [Oryza sativa Japonica Group]BAD09166.1 putative NAD(P)-dependent cholesterol dehydrogenase [Oryza sativa Japonica Group]BAF09838.1 Os02g0715200 [Oryza sativa Japonica Group]BAG92176.1 unnamed protein product [Oryza sativa Japonica Group]|eukprot:NP_001047924.1 Os02g0715200 [Oryza sativa Japonica Group]
MHLSENEGIEGVRFAVTGGQGFVGSALCLELLRRGAREVRSLDLRASSPWSDQLLGAGVRFFQGDVRKKEDVGKALRGVDCVFHLASYGMSGKEMVQAGRADEVNINGTCNVLDACHEHGVRRLVYVSTYNVVFGGEPIVNGNEALPYFPVEDHVDAYARSKSIAEQLVLKSNGRQTKSDKSSRLYTCSIRPAAIYGPGEERHLPRILSLAKLGLAFFKIGDPNVKSDWVYVDNLVLALILASMGLLDDIPDRKGIPVAAGQAYFICDGSPVNTFEFLSPLFQSLDYTVPRVRMDTSVALAISRFFVFMYTLLYPWLDSKWIPQPLLLPAEVYKVGVTHYFSYLKAREEIGYVPMVSPREGLAATISYWQERKRKELDGPTIFPWLFVTIGMLALFSAAYLPPVGPLKWVLDLHLFVFRSKLVIRLVFVIATALHVGEAVYAWFLAKKYDPRNATGWFWQTFMLGFFSLRYLLKRMRE